MVACGSNNHSTAATVRIAAGTNTKSKVKTENRCKNQVQITVNNVNKIGLEKVKTRKVIKRKTEKTAKIHDDETLLNPNESYQDISPIQKTCEVSLFKSKTYKDFISI